MCQLISCVAWFIFFQNINFSRRTCSVSPVLHFNTFTIVTWFIAREIEQLRLANCAKVRSCFFAPVLTKVHCALIVLCILSCSLVDKDNEWILLLKNKNGHYANALWVDLCEYKSPRYGRQRNLCSTPLDVQLDRSECGRIIKNQQAIFYLILKWYFKIYRTWNGCWFIAKALKRVGKHCCDGNGT